MSGPVSHVSTASLPEVPLTIEGASVLHQMVRVRWPEWKKLPAAEQQSILDEASRALEPLEARPEGQSAAFSLLGHKGDLLFMHFRDSLEELRDAELQLQRLRLFDYLEPTTSYVSVVELGLYESSTKTYRALAEQGFEQHGEEWNRGINETLQRQRAAMRPRLYPEFPDMKYICFYPMDRKRGEAKNWYTVSMSERQRMMHEHGMVGRRYAGEVRQIISGSIGLDDWEWGVTLFANDPVSFKKLIYEMRFDEVSAVYALFGQFYVGVKLPATELGKVLRG